MKIRKECDNYECESNIFKCGEIKEIYIYIYLTKT